MGVALSDLDRTLGDHVHCEKKAAASALKLIADHPDRPGLVRPLARLAQEESQHFLAVLLELQRRGAALPPDGGDDELLEGRASLACPGIRLRRERHREAGGEEESKGETQHAR